MTNFALPCNQNDENEDLLDKFFKWKNSFDLITIVAYQSESLECLPDPTAILSGLHDESQSGVDALTSSLLRF